MPHFSPSTISLQNHRLYNHQDENPYTSEKLNSSTENQCLEDVYSSY